MDIQKKKPRVPQQRRSIKTKKLIIDAAMELFSQKGFYATNSKEIAKKAGVATGCFYSYFADKKGVFREALRMYLDRFNAILRENMAMIDEEDVDGRVFLRGMITGILRAHDVFAGFHDELIVMYYSDPEIRELSGKYDARVVQSITRYMKRAEGRLRVSDPDTAAFVVYCAVCRVVDCIFLSKDEVYKEKVVDQLVDMVATYLFL